MHTQRAKMRRGEGGEVKGRGRVESRGHSGLEKHLVVQLQLPWKGRGRLVCTDPVTCSSWCCGMNIYKCSWQTPIKAWHHIMPE